MFLPILVFVAVAINHTHVQSTRGISVDRPSWVWCHVQDSVDLHSSHERNEKTTDMDRSVCLEHLVSCISSFFFYNGNYCNYNL